MRKLKLNLDSLNVQTFETAKDTASQGTVKAYDSWGTTGGPWFCPYYCETGESCNNICG
jgi:hypothetical protein